MTALNKMFKHDSRGTDVSYSVVSLRLANLVHLPYYEISRYFRLVCVWINFQKCISNNRSIVFAKSHDIVILVLMQVVVQSAFTVR